MKPDIDTELSLTDYLRVFKRRAGLFAAVLAGVLLIGVAFAFRTTPLYESTGVLLAERPGVPEHVVRSSIPDYPEERVRIMTQRVLTNENLERIIDERGLYPELAGQPNRALAEFRRHLSLSAEQPEMLENILGAADAAGALAFSVSFRHRSPSVARDVSGDLVSLYRDENQRARLEQATDTTRFLTQEARRLEEEIAAREARLSAFKREHAASLPELTDMNLQLLDRTERDLQQIEQEIRTLRERREMYSAELTQLSPHAPVVNEEGAPVLGPEDRLRMLQRQYVQLAAVYSEAHPDVARLRREIAALSASSGLPAFDRDMLLVDLEAREEALQAARDQYSPDHPDVQRLESAVTRLREQLRQAPPARAGSLERPAPDNPAYLQRQVQLRATETELEAAVARRDELRARLSELEGRLTATPEIEREYNTLQRGHEQLLAQHGDVQAKLREAEMSRSLESESNGERFTLLAAPSLPSSPAQPNRLAVLLLTVAIGGLLSAGAVAVAEKSDATIRSARDVAAYLEIPPLVAVPYVSNRSDIRRRGFRRALAATAACLWAGTIALLVMTPAT